MDSLLILELALVAMLATFKRVFHFGQDPVPVFEELYALALKYSGQGGGARRGTRGEGNLSDAASAGGGTRSQGFKFASNNPSPPRGGAF